MFNKINLTLIGNKNLRNPTLLLAFCLFLLVGIIRPLGGETNQERLKNRQTFPGRRIGGGTRGKCNSRLLVHLVPSSNIYTPDSSKNIALLIGPSNEPKSLLIKFSKEKTEKELIQDTQVLDSSTSKVIIIKSPDVNFPIIWESSFDCNKENKTHNDPLNFVESFAPPAKTLIKNKSQNNEDKLNANKILNLTAKCNQKIYFNHLLNLFDLNELRETIQPGSKINIECINK